MENRPSGIYYSPDTGGGTGGNPATPDNEPSHDIEDALAHRMYYRTESLSSEFMTNAETPEELFEGLRELESLQEDGNVPGGLAERYTPPRMLTVIHERKKNLQVTPAQLARLHRLVNYDPVTGEGLPTKRRFASYAISVDEEPVMIEDKRSGRRRQIDTDVTYNFGTTERRAELARAYEKAETELEVRNILGEYVSLRLNLDFRDNLEGLVGMMHGGRMPKLRSDHLNALFNMPGLAEMEANPENHALGDQVEEAVFLNLVMLNSGNKERMQDFLRRPGAKHLIAKLAKEEEARRQQADPSVSYSVDQWTKDNIGDVDRWDDDNNRRLTSSSRGEATWRIEARDHRRGRVTQWSNIAAWGGKPSEFTTEKENDYIENVIGGLVGSVEASWVSATMMRAIGAYASEGYVAIKGQSLLPLGEGRYISGDDTGKFMTYMFHMKEGLKGRASGLKDMIGRIPDMSMNLFDWAAVEMPDLPRTPDGTLQKRSLWDAWLGTEGGKPKIDLLTGRPAVSGARTTEEQYHRLGSLNFRSLERDFHGTFSIMQWLMGNERGPVGVYTDAIRTDGFRFEDDFSLNELKKKIKYHGIVMNEVVMTKGSLHLYENPGDAVKVIQKNFLTNLIAARVNSASFAMNILGQKVRLFNPGATGDYDVEIPSVKLIELIYDEAVKRDGLLTEDDLKKHYVDENKRMRSLPRKDTDADAVLNRFQNSFVDNVGIVRGKNRSF